MKKGIKIISGGQTGVDRAALDAALACGVACGGRCPEGRLAEDGPIAAHYPLTEMQGAGYVERTLQNVLDSDGTVIICRGALEGGTAVTRQFCIEHRKNFVVIDASRFSAEQAHRTIAEFVRRHHIASLNVAGPRASKQPGIYRYAREALETYLTEHA